MTDRPDGQSPPGRLRTCARPEEATRYTLGATPTRWAAHTAAAGREDGPLPRSGSPAWAARPAGALRRCAALVLAAQCWHAAVCAVVGVS